MSLALKLECYVPFGPLGLREASYELSFVYCCLLWGLLGVFSFIIRPLVGMTTTNHPYPPILSIDGILV
jgi:hypothetical protein